jgi:LacI family gluconate utilization system Gnt-I transcriptional repressor
MRDVARLAQVSSMTVSRVLRNPERVARETRRRVERAIAEARYVPDLVAAGLASQRTHLVAVLIPTLNDSIFADTVQGIADVLGPRGYEFVLGNTGYSPEVEERLLRALLGRRPDGFIITGVHHGPRVRRLLTDAGVPIVETWDMTPRPLDSVVGFDNEAAGYAMARHLIESGRRRIAWIGSSDARASARRAGYERALAEVGGQPIAFAPERPSLQSGGEAFQRLWAAHPDVEAVFFSSDALAAGGWFVCRRKGIEVPGQVALAGLGDFEVGQEIEPPLSTVRVPRYDLGRRAAEVLL